MHEPTTLSPPPGIKGPHGSLISYTRSAAGFLEDISKSANGVPFLSTIAGVTMLILTTVESVKRSRDGYMRLVERIYDILRALINLRADGRNLLSAAMLEGMAQFSQTLRKIQSFIVAHQEMGTIKCLLRTTQRSIQLEEFNSDLDEALERFKVRTESSELRTILEMQAQEEGKHQELMTLVDLRTGGGSSTGSIRTLHSSSSRRSILLPARPKIFYGRDHELHEIVTTLKQDSPRLVLLGTGGIGKTSLALSVLYHEQVAARFKHRHFISCESAANGADIVSAIAEHLGVAESVGSIIEDLSASEPTILVLDNFESPWEPFESRSDVEGLLSRLAGIQHVALLVTMRGAERPGQVRWTRPFLAPLSPLSRAAAMQTLSAIVDHEDDDETRKLADTVLDFTDNLPLAVQLIGAVASFEGFVPVIKRWQLENTALLSEGPTKGSNLDNSISLSLSSPRMLSIPSARQLLGVLSLLPDGLPDTDLAGLNLPISDSGKAKAALLRTSLAYAADGRLKMLAPVREYVQRNHPPAPAVLQRLVGYISELLNVWKAFNKFASGELVPRLKSSAGNVRSVLLYAVETDQGRAELIQTGKALLLFIQFLAVTGTGDGGSDLRKLLPSMVERAEDDELHGLYMVMQFSLTFDAVEDPEALALKAVQHFRKACRKNPICLIRADET